MRGHQHLLGSGYRDYRTGTSPPGKRDRTYGSTYYCTCFTVLTSKTFVNSEGPPSLGERTDEVNVQQHGTEDHERVQVDGNTEYRIQREHRRSTCRQE